MVAVVVVGLDWVRIIFLEINVILMIYCKEIMIKLIIKYKLI